MSSYEVGTQCWYPDETLGWIGVEITSHKREGGKTMLGLKSEADGSSLTVSTAGPLDDTNSDLPLLRNPPILEAAEDLTSLSYLNEPAVLHAIKVRYSQMNIYTYSGIVLIATNPFQRVDQLYSPDIIQSYSGKRRGELEPHLFAIAEEAYRCMKTDGENQTIVVSGESGAGKTVSAKYIMRYFASVKELDSAVGSHTPTDMSDTEKQILATNPIMEAFGNAKTTRNDNSSRFGKYLEILFDKGTNIIGARIRTYLLERSRLVFQPKIERNYHIFYQLIAGATAEEREKFSLAKVEDYYYLNQGGEARIAGIDDVAEFKITNEALSMIGIKDDQQFEIYQILAALLHMGNIEITATRNDAHLSSEDPDLIKACDLLGIDAYNFSKWIVKKQITTRSEKIISNLSHKQAIVARDSVAKYIYSALFDWLVEYVNIDLCPEEVVAHVASFIGVLDIYGFEHFEKNSFEQFCINYANEKLQQEFNQHVFKLEQEEYIREEIEWSFIEFADNQPCIDLIENKLGILALLDEESRMPAGADESWIEKMYLTLDKAPTNAVFKKPRFGNTKFIVSHYALDVAYDAEGFIEKNRDTVSEGHLDTLKETSNSLLKGVLATIDRNAEKLETAKAAAAAAAGPGRRVVNKKPTLGSIFKTSLIELMKTIESTNVHYIRCIKPNEEKKAWEFDPLMVLSQLRACGVLETIRISCAGFPTRWTYAEFADRYHILVSSEIWNSVLNGSASEDQIRLLCNKILEKSVASKETYQLGNTKIFFKAGMLAVLEKKRTDTLHNAAVMIQKNVRMIIYRNQYLQARASIIDAQALFRGFSARVRVQKAIEEHAATKIQTASRGFLARKRFSSTQRSVVTIQSAIRGIQTRRNVTKFRTEKSAVALQQAWRNYTGRRDFKAMARAALYVQCCLRRRLAKIEFRKLMAEAKSVNRLKEVSYTLENKVIELTQSLSAKITENKLLIAQITTLQGSLAESGESREKLKAREAELSSQFDLQSAQHLQETGAINADLARVRDEFVQAEAKIQELTSDQNALKEEVRKHLEELEQAKEEIAQRNAVEGDLKSTISQLKAELAILAAQGPVANGRADKSRLVTNGQWNGQPVSIIPVSGKEEINANSINEELWNLLQDSKSLHKEIVDGLLKGLKIPPAGVAADLTRKEVLFPARIIIIILSDMWRLGFTKESEEFLGEVLSVIQEIVSALKDEDIIAHGAFWLSNTHELYSFVSYAQSTIIENDAISNEMTEQEYDEYLRLVAVVKEDFESLSFNIYNMWMKKLEKDLEKKAISAVVLSQSLPGFMAPESSPFLAKVFSQGTQYKMDDILSFFNAVYWSMKTYFIESEVMKEVVVELLRFVDALCFNDLIMRRNFLSWKRGLQLNYNVTRLEEWCKAHDIDDGSSYLSHLLQAAKLLQLRKNTTDDIDIIYEICYDLKPSQIQKIISQYHVADYETPIAPDVLRAVADKVKSHGGNEDYFEALSPEDHFEDPFRNIPLRPFSRVEAYVPAWLNLPIIRRIIELVAKNASVQDTADDGYEESHPLS
ncbi:hypothetical protein BABINDRAFT_163668 [Babjeviella inositovora NRRL Y-12698]|uniref:Myosin motor domain-containing protein n=1 Tax=Babjeviella inositovora NRRL Y-12698 TaxID=984486 RepID=A0A1E3QHI5_9ASCO|nr:uncharacterized protein BABINDRAFT_163668 [Babjeviella inositovora NRRL Y-12698]ODQ77156.1 hypothetical protein BABINDRAFT_163668 [Babjeviella inositovora NRRL Y-12698]